LIFVQHEAPTTLFPEEEQAARVTVIEAEIARLSKQLAGE
jgi:hypothetical protein